MIAIKPNLLSSRISVFSIIFHNIGEGDVTDVINIVLIVDITSLGLHNEDKLNNCFVLVFILLS